MSIYQFNIHAVPLFITAILISILVILAIPKTLEFKTYQYFFILCISIFVWLFGATMGYFSTDPEQASFWFKVDNFGVMFVSVCFLGIATSETKIKMNRTIILGFITSFIFGILGLFFSYFISSSKSFYWGYFPQWKFINSLPFFIFWFAYALTSLLVLYKGIKSTKSEQKKTYLKFLVIGILVSYLASIDYLSAFGLSIYPIGFIPIILFLFILAYAIMKHSLMDIDLVWRYFLEKILYFTFTVIILLFTWKFLFRQPIDLYLFFFFALCVIFIPSIRSLVSKQLRILLLKKYTNIWKKMEEKANAEASLYTIKDITSVLTIDIPQIMNLKKSNYYHLNEKDLLYRSIFSSDQHDIIKFDNPIVARIKATKERINRDNLIDSKEGNKLKKFMEDSGYSLAYPIILGHTVIGIMIFGEKRNNQLYHNEDLEQLAILIKKAQEQIKNVLNIESLSYNYAEKALSQYKATYQMHFLRETRKIGEIRDLNKLIIHILSLLNHSVNSKHTYLYLYDESKRVYMLQQVSSTEHDLPFFVKEDEYLMSYLRGHKDILLYDSVKKWAYETRFSDMQAANALASKLKATVIIPLIDTTLLGFLVVGDKIDKKHFTDDDFFVMSLIADRSESNIRNILSLEKAEKDSLTRLHNKDYLNRRIKEEVVNSLKYGGLLGFLMIDVDDFKLINENNRDIDGNKILLAIVSVIKKLIRPEYEFCRYDDHSFAILLTDIDEENTISLANKVLGSVRTNERINQLIEQYQHKITVSIGISSFNPFTLTGNFTNEAIYRISLTLIMRAELALKQAQKNGKDQLQVAVQLSAGEEGFDSDIFAIKILIVSQNDSYKEISASGCDIDVLESINEALQLSGIYDILFLDMSVGNVGILKSIQGFRDENMQLIIGVFTENIKYKAEIEANGGKFLPAPLEPVVIEEFLGYLKKQVIT
ncbi:MAG: diguanylate cyclase [bacterium]|nr:diguanylate cyclase [bacterium]